MTQINNLGSGGILRRLNSHLFYFLTLNQNNLIFQNSTDLTSSSFPALTTTVLVSVCPLAIPGS